jgi:hypothetical protein
MGDRERYRCAIRWRYPLALAKPLVEKASKLRRNREQEKRELEVRSFFKNQMGILYQIKVARIKMVNSLLMIS